VLGSAANQNTLHERHGPKQRRRAIRTRGIDFIEEVQIHAVGASAEYGKLDGLPQAYPPPPNVPAAEEELVRTFGQRVFVMALVRTRDAESARDLRQDP
jgi:hypothetical protein